ncbi:RNA polymerase sigma factor [Povalibacter sp.]|uniref:RNA polymerase sigma factor n=1 Tax=Povalibacter sp. TaxID=1962978 RepID=UPI002F3F5184
MIDPHINSTNAALRRNRIGALAQCSDDELVAAARQRHNAAFEALMRRYNRRLFRVARSVLRDAAAAEDAVQECYVQAFTHLHRYRPGAFGAWLTRIALNEALMMKRRLRRTTVSLDDIEEQADRYLADESLTTPDASQETSARQLLEQSIDTLPQAFRTVFLLRAVEQLSIAETATCLSLNEATVKTRFHRAQIRLRNDITQRLQQEHLTLFDFGAERCDRIVANVLTRLSGIPTSATPGLLL